MIAAGQGAQVELPVGNKRPIPAIGRPAAPVTLTGTVRAITDGSYVITGPTYTGQTACMGRSAVLDIGAAQLVITERTHEPWDLGVFESLGIDPREARFILVKSRMYCRPVFVPISCALVECDSPGVTSSDFSLFPYQRRNRPRYPLEPFAGAYVAVRAGPMSRQGRAWMSPEDRRRRGHEVDAGTFQARCGDRPAP